MNETELLTRFEEKYKFLYEEMVNGVPLYTCLRDDVLLLLQGGHATQSSSEKKGRVYVHRLLDDLVKVRKLSSAKTLIFTSAMYRRDHGRNLAVEYLMNRYPDAVAFEWPSRNEDFDSAYFNDPQRDRYCPLDAYLVVYKVLSAFYRKGLKRREDELRAKLKQEFAQAPTPEDENEQAAADMVISQLPVSCVETSLSQGIFKKTFRRYKNVEYAIDFWGSGRENIFPVLPGNPEKIELQHGIITSFHPGYIYPSFVRENKTDFFKRKLLVYGEATKKLLCDRSVFNEEQIEVVGNPRVLKFKKLFSQGKEKRNLIVFTSQGYGEDFYCAITPYLKTIVMYIKDSTVWKDLELVIKLHPRETTAAIKRYKDALPDCVVYDNSSQLYDLFNAALIHITVTSTALFEAAAFDVPTILIPYSNYTDLSLYGFNVWTFAGLEDVPKKLKRLSENYQMYTTYLKDNAKMYS